MLIYSDGKLILFMLAWSFALKVRSTVRRARVTDREILRSGGIFLGMNCLQIISLQITFVG
jgi:hypothetical protein